MRAPVMRRRSSAALAVLLGVFLAVAAVLPAAATGSSARARPRPPAPPPGWPLAGARFEPLDPATPMTAVGVGEFRGSLEVVRQADGRLAVVNEVAFEDYLKGVSEIPTAWPFEAQKAQA